MSDRSLLLRDVLNRPAPRASARGRDESDVSNRCIARFACAITPRLEAKLAREARRRGLSSAALVRDLIDKGIP